METRYQTNDPQSRSCMGSYRGNALDPLDGCTSEDPTSPPWGCPNDSCPGEGPNTTHGYFLITELEQVYSTVLQSTLCISYPGFDVSTAEGWMDDAAWGRNCRGSSQWDPTASNNSGLPKGDWCSVTNGPATATCHDAFRSVSYHTFSGFDIKDETCGF